MFSQAHHGPDTPLTLVAVCVDGLHRLADELPPSEFAKITSGFAGASDEVVQRHGGSVVVSEPGRMLAAWLQVDDIVSAVEDLAKALQQVFVVEEGPARTRPAFCIGVGAGACAYDSSGSTVTGVAGSIASRVERIAFENVRRSTVVIDSSVRERFARTELRKVGAGVFAVDLPGVKS